MASKVILEVIESQEQEIKDAITSIVSVHKFADKLVANNFITREQRSDVLDEHGPPRNKARQLFEAVQSQVKLDPRNFNVFIKILEEEPPLKALAVNLKCEFGKLNCN